MSTENLSINGLVTEIFDLCHFEMKGSLIEQLKEKKNEIKRLEEKLKEYSKHCTCVNMKRIIKEGLLNEKEEEEEEEEEEGKKDIYNNRKDNNNFPTLANKRSDTHNRNKSAKDDLMLFTDEKTSETRTVLRMRHERSNSASAVMKSVSPSSYTKRSNYGNKNNNNKNNNNNNNNNNNEGIKKSGSNKSSGSNGSSGSASREKANLSRAFTITNVSSPRQSPHSPLPPRIVGNGKKKDSAIFNQIKVKFTYPTIDGYIYRLKGSRGEIRFRFQVMNAEKLDKVAYIDVFDCEQEEAVQSNIEVNNILRGNFKLVVDEKMQLSKKRLCLHVHCYGKQALPNNTSKKAHTFESKHFYIEFGTAQGSNVFVKKSPDEQQQQQQQQNKKTVKKFIPTKLNSTSPSKLNKTKLVEKTNVPKKGSRSEKRTQQQQQQDSSMLAPGPPSVSPLTQSDENSRDIKSPETKSDDDRSPLPNSEEQKSLALGDTFSVGSDINDTDTTTTTTTARLSLISSKGAKQANHKLRYGDSSDEESNHPEKIEELETNHTRNPESIEIDHWIKRKFSTKGPLLNHGSTTLDEKDLVIVVAYSDSEEDDDDNNDGFTEILPQQ